MRSFPLISELPEIIDASDWAWQKPPHRNDWMGLDPEWWIGVDPKAQKWLVKMTNSVYAYREHAFASLAQRLGISCQSSAYLLIESENAAPRHKLECAEPCQLAIWLMDEHATKPCSETCALRNIPGKHTDYVAIGRASASGIAHFEDLVRGDVLGHLCGQFEPHGDFFTIDHEYVVIDNECMFGGRPSLNECRWLEIESAGPLILEVCRSILRLSLEELETLAAVPTGYTISDGRNLCDDLRAARSAASDYLSFAKTEINEI